jgi:hypothetical protein
MIGSRGADFSSMVDDLSEECHRNCVATFTLAPIWCEAMPCLITKLLLRWRWLAWRGCSAGGSRLFAVAVAAAIAFLRPALAQPADPDLPFSALTGHWRGPHLDLVIDYDRMLGNTDQKAKPFQRDVLRIRNRTGSMFVFSVGTRQFIGMVDGDEMRLTGDGVPGTEVLRRLRR